MHLGGWFLLDPPGYRNTQPLPVVQALPDPFGRRRQFLEFGLPFPEFGWPFPEFEGLFPEFGGAVS